MHGVRRSLLAAVCALACASACTDEPVAGPDPAPSSSRASAPEDVAFMQMMVLHHRQALEMAGLVQDRGSSEQVRAVAARIEAAQAPEILVMAQWLTERSIDVPGVHEDPALYDHAQHGHAGMEGMLTDDQLDELEDADGATFDALFLEDMISHHEGAVSMARYVLVHGTDPRVNELATGIVAEQEAEIGRLRDLLDVRSD